MCGVDSSLTDTEGPRVHAAVYLPRSKGCRGEGARVRENTGLRPLTVDDTISC